MSLVDFENHLRDVRPGFRCYASGDRTDTVKFLARLRHEVGRPASEKSLKAATELAGTAASTMTPFLKLHDGVVLYRDTLSDTAGVEFFKVADWKAKTAEMHEWTSGMGLDDDNWPDWIHRGVVIGDIPHSANYFVLQPDGQNAGRVYYFDHDDFQETPLAESLEELLKMIIEDPANFLLERGCYTRYSDGKTKTQWIPKEYVANCDNEVPL